MKKYLLCAFTFVLVFGLSSCFKSDPVSIFSKRSEIDFTSGKIISDSDSHGGFHGDGSSQVEVYLEDEEVEEKMESSAKWKQLPFEASIAVFFDGLYDETIDLPAIENGYYYFLDRHLESTDDSVFVSRISYNFTMGIYDSDNKTLYIIEYDS